MLFDIPYPPQHFSHLPEQDDWGILAAINDRFERDPEAFGTAAQQAELKRMIDARIAAEPACVRDRGFYEDIRHWFDREGLHPLRDRAIALVGCWTDPTRGPSQPTYTNTAPLLEMFGRVHDIAAADSGRFYTENALQRTNGQKVDYVVTGNVLNAPDTIHHDDTFMACAALLGEGGRAIHMLQYGQRRPQANIGDSRLHRLCGQRHLFNVPPGEYQPQCGGTEMMVLAQEHALGITAQHSDYYRRHRQQRAYPVLHSSAGTALDLQALQAHLEAHPDRIAAVPPVDMKKLATDPAELSLGDMMRYPGFTLPSSITLPAGWWQDNSAVAARDEVRAAFAQWRDGHIEALAGELTPRDRPAAEITAYRFRSTGNVVETAPAIAATVAT